MNLTDGGKSKRGRPVNSQLREDIIQAAGDMFGEMGLHATKMEHIAAKLKISKLTLYSRFENKDALFAAVIQKKCQELLPRQQFSELDASDPVSSLNHICIGLMNLLLSDTVQGMERMLMALENAERESLTRLFYEEGPKRVIALIEQHLLQLKKNKKLYIKNAAVSANVLAAMIKGSDICTRRQMNIEPISSEQEIKTYCFNVVDLFIRGCGQPAE
jgi:AcrR family transcriptional regulator